MKKMFLLPMLFLSLFIFVACGNDEEPTEEKDIIYVTSYSVKFLVESIGKDVVDVRYVPGSQLHGHSYDWSARELLAMQDASYLFYVGAGLDPFIDANLSTLTAEGLPVLRLSDFINPLEICLIHDHDDHDDENDYHDDENDHHDDENDHHDDECDDTELVEDAHFWLDVVRMMEAAQIIKERLILTFPDDIDRIENNYLVLIKQLEKLHEDYVSALTNRSKPIITNVKLFTYYQDRYGLDIHPLTKSAHAHEDESIPSDYLAFVEFALENNINYILFEKYVNSPAGNTLLTELQHSDRNPDAEALYLHPIGFLQSSEINAGKNYITIMYENLEVLIKATAND